MPKKSGEQTKVDEFSPKKLFKNIFSDIKLSALTF